MDKSDGSPDPPEPVLPHAAIAMAIGRTILEAYAPRTAHRRVAAVGATRTEEECSMPEISLPTFVDFVLASSTGKVTVVRNAKGQHAQGDNAATDLYKPLRECIIHAVRQNLTSQETRVSLHTVPFHLNEKQAAACDACIIGYEKWRARKQVAWDKKVASKTSIWKQGCLAIRIAPELGVVMKDVPHIVQLYFKEEIPSMRRLQPIIHLLREHARKYPQAIVGVLDVRRGQFHTSRRDVLDGELLLAGEAAAFQTIWDKL